ncbi:hypothetical protein ABK898_25745, partial [Klebsiella sp. KE9038]|uniref:hypothetical protein n=1 Tax=Klebsiella sp. KE9038 TaxID=3118149 RepID=UPI00375112D9
MMQVNNLEVEAPTLGGTSAIGTVSVGSEGKERTITNVAAGRVGIGSTDAINGSQLYAVIDSPIIFAGNDGSVPKRLGEDMPLSIVGEKGVEGEYSGRNLTTRITSDANSSNIEIQIAENPEFESVTTGNTMMNTDGLTITDGPSVTTGGINAGNKVIREVADGVDAKDAVNVSQLETLANKELTFQGNNGSVAKKLGDTVDIVGAGSTGGAYSGANLKTEVVDGRLQLLMADNPDFTTVNVGENKTTVLTGDGLTIKDGPTFTKDEIDVAGNTIGNVADGVKDSDAVNLSQLKAGTKYFNAFSTGEDSQALGLDAVAIGMGAIAHNASDVALGANSVTDATVGTAGVSINGTDYAFAGANPASTVSVGDAGSERTITNVAAGRLSETSTDAVNGSQLFATNTALEDLNTSVGELTDSPLTFAANQGDNAKRKLGETMRILGGGATENGETYSAGNVLTELDADGDLTIKLADNAAFTSVTTGNTVMNTDGLTIKDGPTFTKDEIDVAGNTIGNVADGVKDSDAVNLSQLKAGTKYFNAFSTGEDSQALGLDAVAIGMGAIAYNASDVALGANSVTDATVGTAGVSINGTDYAFAGANPASTVSVGDAGSERTITNVAAGRLSETSTDAVNGSQLYATNSAVENLNTSVGELTDSPLTFAANQGDNAKRKLGETMRILGGGATENGETYSAGNVLTELDADGDLTIKLADNATFESLTTGNTVMNTDGLTITDGPTFTKDEIDVAGNTIGNVADGVKDSDAVNLSQLKAGTKYFNALSTGEDSQALGLDSVAIGMGAIANNASDVALGANSVTDATVGTAGVSINGTDYAFAGANPASTVSVGDAGSERTITNVAAGRLSETSTDAVNGSQLYATNSAVENLNTSVGELTDSPLTFAANQGDNAKRKLGETMRILGGGATGNGETYSAGNVLTELDADGDLTIKLADNAAFTSVTTGNTVMNTDGLTIKDGPTFTKDEIDVAGNTIGNVADGVKDSDAVNLSQLKAGTKYFNAFSTGEDSQALGLDAVAIGMGAIAHNASDVALGANSVTDATVGTAGVSINGTDYAFAGANPTSTVSVGDAGSERTITNVAAGRLSETSTDAVNGSQLYATNSAVENLNTSVGELTDSPLTFAANQGDNAKRKLGETMRILGGGATENGETYSAGNVLTELDADGDLTIKLADNATFESLTTGNTVMNTDGLTIKDGPTFTKDEIDVAGNTIGNVADGVKDSDAVNLSQLKAGTKYFNAFSTGEDSQALGLDSVAIGMGAIAYNASDVALGANSVTDATVGTAGVSINGTDYAFAGANPASTVSVGDAGSERTITNVAAGRLSETSTDAVNGSQLYATNSAVENLNTSVGGLQKDALLWDTDKGVFSASHGDTTVNKITNVEAGELGEKSTDAVNGSQLFATNQNVETNTTNIAKNTQNISNLGDTVENIYTTGTKYFHANSTGADSQALGLDSVAIGMGAIAHNASDVALGANSVTDATVGTAGVSINGTDYAFAGANPASTVSV